MPFHLEDKSLHLYITNLQVVETTLRQVQQQLPQVCHAEELPYVHQQFNQMLMNIHQQRKLCETLNNTR